jgi:hypothetical protein
MITDQKTNKVTSGGRVLDGAAYHINPENVVHITQILRNFYGDPLKAVIREYVCNAIDAHQQDGIERPIELHVPSTHEPYLSVRDFGTGLNVADTKQLLYGYGSSGDHKRVSNNQIGGFGLGCKSAFSISTAFTYTIWHEGMRRTWSCYLDEYDAGQANMLEEVSDTDSPSGILVQIPVSGDMASQPDKCYHKISSLFGFMQPNVELTNYPETDITAWEEPTASVPMKLSVNDQEVTLVVNAFMERGFEDDVINPIVTVGGIPYSVNTKELNLDNRTCEFFTVDRWSNHGSASSHIQITLPIGLVQPAPNRESLQYSGSAKKILQHIFTQIASTSFREKMTARAKDKFKCDNIRDRVRRTYKLPWLFPPEKNTPYVRNDSLAAYIKDSFGGLISKVSVDTIPQDGVLKFHKGYVHHYLNLDYPAKQVESLFPTSKSRLCVLVSGVSYDKDPCKSKVYMDRVYTYLSQTPEYKAAVKDLATNRLSKLLVSLAFVRKADDKVPWSTDGSVVVVEEKDLPDESAINKSLTYRRDRRQSSYSRGSSPGVAAASSHKLHIMEGKTSSYGTNSDSWCPCKVADNVCNTYVVMDRFVVVPAGHGGLQSATGDYLFQLFATRNSDAVKATIHNILPDVAPGLLGVRVSGAESLEKSPKFQYLWDYVYKRFSEDVASGKLDTEVLAQGLYFFALREHSYMGDLDLGTVYQGTTADYDRFGSRWLSFARSIADTSGLKGTELHRRMKWWSDRNAEVLETNACTNSWIYFLSSLMSRTDNRSLYGELAELRCLLRARHAKTDRHVVDWDLLKGGELGDLFIRIKESLGDSLYDDTIMTTYDTASTIRLNRDMSFLFDNHPQLFKEAQLFQDSDYERGNRYKKSSTKSKNPWYNMGLYSVKVLSTLDDKSYLDFLKAQDKLIKKETRKC